MSGRIYRATWALVALPLLVLAFTIGRPDSLPPPALPPSFDPAVAARLATELGETFPIRSPGTEDASRATAWVKSRLAAYGLTVREQPFEAEIPGRGRVRLVNLVATPTSPSPERSSDAIVVMAHRDNSGISRGLDDNASGTGALIELARDLSTVTLTHTILFVSTDGGAFGNLGAAELASSPSFRRGVLAVVDLDSLAGRGQARLEFSGDGPRAPSGELLATADGSVLAQTGHRARHPGPLAQLLGLAFPFSLYDQAPFVGAGVSALTLTSAGERPPRPDSDTAAAFDATRLGELGRSAQMLVASLDAAPEVARGTGSYVYLGGRAVRGFAIEFLLVVAMLPALLATLDLAARLRRRGIGIGPALRSFRSRLGVWAWLGLLAALFSVLGAFPHGGGRPLAPDTPAAQDWPVAALLGLGALSACGWLLARPRLIPRGDVDREDELAGHLVLMTALSLVSIAVAVSNPFALVFVLPSLHAWLWIPHVRESHVAARVGVYALGFAGPLLFLISFAVRFGIGMDTPWYVATLFSVGYAPLVFFLAFLVWGACACQAAAISAGRYAPYPTQEERPARGPLREGVRRVVLARRARSARRSAERDEADGASGGQLTLAARDVNESVRLRSRHDHV